MFWWTDVLKIYDRKILTSEYGEKVNVSVTVHITNMLPCTKRKGTHSPGQVIWNKMQQSSKTGQEKKSLVSVFACFLTAFGKL